MSKQHSVLILTDSSTHTGKESLFPIAAHLTQNPLIASVHVADRADAENEGFYKNLNPDFSEFHVRAIDGHFSFDGNDLSTYAPSRMTTDEFDAIWVRLDHPVSDDFLRYARALLPDHFFINDPDGLIETASKEFLIDLQATLGDLMPPTKLCRTADEVEVFKEQCPDGMVLKQVLSYGGKGVVRYRPDGESEIKNKDDAARYLAENGMVIAMAFLNPPGRQSDRRVVIMNGVVVSVLDRIAKEGGWLCNLTSGASAEMGEVTDRERNVAERLDPVMRKHGIFLYGADMLLNSEGKRVLSEVNTLNVGTIAVAEKLSGRPVTKFIADNLASVIAARDFHVPVSGQEAIAA